MQPDERTRAYLWDIKNAAYEINSFVRGVKYVEFEKNKILRYAVERQLLVIGEAAVHISPQYRRQHPEIPWGRLVELRKSLRMNTGRL